MRDCNLLASSECQAQPARLAFGVGLLHQGGEARRPAHGKPNPLDLRQGFPVEAREQEFRLRRANFSSRDKGRAKRE